MIDLLTVVYRNYNLLDLQLEHWARLGGDYRLLVCDNTPRPDRRSLPDRGFPVFELDVHGIDGETHGAALDFLVRQSSSPILGIFDTDFFFLRPDILEMVQERFAAGYRCIGCAGFYPDWQRVIDTRWPERAGHLAPVCWGMFVERELALSETFVVTAGEASAIHETGWRLREKLIREQIPCEVWPGTSMPSDPELCYFGDPEKPLGFHLLKGSAWRQGMTPRIPALLEEGLSKWHASAKE